MDRRKTIMIAFGTGISIIATPIIEIIIQKIIGEKTIVRLIYQTMDAVGTMTEMLIMGVSVGFVLMIGICIIYAIVKGNAGWLIAWVNHRRDKRSDKRSFR